MKTKCNFIFFLILILAIGCASPPKKEQPKPAAQLKETTLSQPAPEVTLKELVIPQKEEAKKVPEKLFSFFARDASIQDVLLSFSRESDLNIVIDPEVSGKVTIDLKRVTLREALDAILFPLGWTYRIDGRFIQITRPQMETRLFTLNYISTKRTGKREIYASTGGGLQTGALLGQQGAVSTGGTRTGFSDLVSIDEMDIWVEIQRGLETIIFGSVDEKEKAADKEKAALARVDGKGRKLVINKSTGVIWVTDYPANLNKVASYLETVEGSSQRQVTIQAKIMEVILSDQYKAGINWKVIEGLPRSINLSWGLTDKTGTTGYPGGTTSTTSGTTTGGIATPGTFKIKPFGGTLAIGALGTEVALSDIVQAISEQGDVKILSNPTISTLNNQKAIIRVGDQDVFFITGAIATQNTVTQTIQPMTIDIGIILDVTPQIAEDGTIIMNIHPSITEKTGEKVTPDGKTTFPLLSVRETDTTVRVRDNQTIIIAGLMAEKKEEAAIGVPLLKSIPLLGHLFRYKTENKKKSELVIMITPTVQIGKKVEDFTQR
jgi:MSHA type pilus biogenesis protein MshL